MDYNIIDPLNQCIYAAHMEIADGRIADIVPIESCEDFPYVMPGLVDAHIHIESSMLIPSQFAKIALRHGVIACVADPHEIANVLGVEGVEYMIRDAQRTPFYYAFTAPSCVPSTNCETAGSCINAKEIEQLIMRNEIHGLAEMMNVPGVLNAEEEVMAKIAAAHHAHKPIDGHAPGVTGEALRRYAAAGISTDHECSTLEEAEERLNLGMKILIREGSAARNFEALAPLLAKHERQLMFCTDDAHPDTLLEGHIDKMVRRALSADYPLWNVLRAATVEPVQHYKIPCGLLQKGDYADFIVIDNLREFNIKDTFIKGKSVISLNVTEETQGGYLNKFDAAPIKVSDIIIQAQECDLLRVIQITDGSLSTEQHIVEASGLIDRESIDVSSTQKDIAKLVVLNRYQQAHPQVALVEGFGLRRGAFGSSIAHDSHNIIVVGKEDESIVRVVNAIIEMQGGMAASDSDGKMERLALPIAGLMSPLPCEQIAHRYKKINLLCKELGTRLIGPLMTLSFLALPVIPHLKLTDKGLFDVDHWRFVPVAFRDGKGQ